LMNKEDLPDPHPSCKNCAYATQREKLSSLS
jgi:hypothetical protein